MGIGQFFRKLFGSEEPVQEPSPGQHTKQAEIPRSNKTQKVVCAWIGTFPSEEAFYGDYLSIDYGDDDFDDDYDDDFVDEEPNSQFGKDAGLEDYDDGFMESWWFENLTVEHVLANRESLLDAEHFFDDLIETLKNRDLSGKNTISFMFGMLGKNPANEDLFDYDDMAPANKPIALIFKKEYTD